MRLLAICAVDEPGGAEIHLLRLVRGLIERGWEVTLTSPSGGGVKAAAEAVGAAWEHLAVGGLEAGTGRRAVASWPRVRRLARSSDVVYLNGTVCGRLLPALRGRRTVLHVHDMVDRVPRHWRLASVVLADSRAVAKRLDGLQAEVVYGPVELDPPAVDPPWPAEPAGPVVAFIGRVEPRKGPLDLALAAPKIHAAVPGARVVVVGGDPYGSDPDYLAQVDAAAGIERYPWAPSGAGLMRHVDVLVLPSRREPFGTVLSEAMAAGAPVVASRVDGLPEVVEDGVTGVLIEPGDPDALALAVAHVLANRERMGAAAREAAQRFDADAYVEHVAALISPPCSPV